MKQDAGSRRQCNSELFCWKNGESCRKFVVVFPGQSFSKIYCKSFCARFLYPSVLFVFTANMFIAVSLLKEKLRPEDLFGEPSINIMPTFFNRSIILIVLFSLFWMQRSYL